MRGQIRQFRKIEKGELFYVAGDCSQGGGDSNFLQFLSRSKVDVPLVYQHNGVASQMTPEAFELLEKIHDITGLVPVVAFERNNGGASEMDRLSVLNINQKFKIWTMPIIGQNLERQESSKLGWDTTSQSRPIMLGDLKNAIDERALTIYDKITLDQLYSFVISKTGKPEADYKAYDDAVMALAIAWQMFQRIKPEVARTDYSQYENYEQEEYNPIHYR